MTIVGGFQTRLHFAAKRVQFARRHVKAGGVDNGALSQTHLFYHQRYGKRRGSSSVRDLKANLRHSHQIAAGIRSLFSLSVRHAEHPARQTRQNMAVNEAPEC